MNHNHTVPINNAHKTHNAQMHSCQRRQFSCVNRPIEPTGEQFCVCARECVFCLAKRKTNNLENHIFMSRNWLKFSWLLWLFVGNVVDFGYLASDCFALFGVRFCLRFRYANNKQFGELFTIVFCCMIIWCLKTLKTCIHEPNMYTNKFRSIFAMQSWTDFASAYTRV